MLVAPFLLNLYMSRKQMTSLRASRAGHTAHVTPKLCWVDAPGIMTRLTFISFLRNDYEKEANLIPNLGQEHVKNQRQASLSCLRGRDVSKEV